jgi:ribosomal-protein-alanine N-acetyltransferase
MPADSRRFVRPQPDPAEPGARRAPLALVRPVEVLLPDAIGTPRLKLRALVAGDRGEFTRVMQESREHLARFSPLHMPGENDEELFDRQLALTTGGDESGRACRRVAVEGAGRIVGAVNLNAIRRGLTWEGDANWWIAATAGGKGYATEALAALLTHAFADMPDGLGLHRVLAGIQSDNEASLRLAARLGFVRAGPGKSYLHAGGKWDLHEMHSVSPEGFEARLAG